MFLSKVNVNPFSFAVRIKRPLILDGAMGSMLQQMVVKPSGPLWMSYVNLEYPEKVTNIHKEYIEAGADIITTNTFRTNPAAVESSHLKINSNKFVKESVKLAIDAASSYPVFIAGSNAPAEDCYKIKRDLSKKKIEYNHKEHISSLYESGCHFILNETHSHFDEIKIICEFCSCNDIPFVISFFIDEKLKLLSGEKLSEIIKFSLDYNPLAIGINCIKDYTFFKFFRQSSLKFNWGMYLNCGSGDYSDENISCGVSPEQYLIYVEKTLVKNPSFIGACCGSTPKHIRKIKYLLDGKTRN